MNFNFNGIKVTISGEEDDLKLTRKITEVLRHIALSLEHSTLRKIVNVD